MAGFSAGKGEKSRAPSRGHRIFIGSGEASVVERKVLIYSLLKHAREPLDIHVFNGTHNALEHDGGIVPAPLPLPYKYRGGDTEFGLYRYLLPQLCGWSGRALYIDSDMICLADIGALFDLPLGDADFLALRMDGDDTWRTSVMPIDCAATRFDLDAIFGGIDRGDYGLGDFMTLSPRFLAHRPYRIGPLDPAWNSFDRHDAGTKLVHYTDMPRQPWKRRGHPYGALWFRYFREAHAAGHVTDRDIDTALRRAYVRRDLRQGFGWRERLLAAAARHL
ncbi:MAG: hypothetical protein KIT16_23580 [Rhodospirillaceae bacterium]|nr:hypothetical protein [Rhodospirillaceae bacterium]